MVSRNTACFFFIINFADGSYAKTEDTEALSFADLATLLPSVQKNQKIHSKQQPRSPSLRKKILGFPALPPRRIFPDGARP